MREYENSNNVDPFLRNFGQLSYHLPSASSSSQTTTMTASLGSALSIPHHIHGKTYELSLHRNPSHCSCLASNNRLHRSRRSRLVSNGSILGRVCAVSRGNLSEALPRTKNYEVPENHFVKNFLRRNVMCPMFIDSSIQLQLVYAYQLMLT